MRAADILVPSDTSAWCEDWMKIKDVAAVNQLIGRLEDVQKMIAAATHAEADDFELFIERPGDGSVRMSAEGASSTHFQGFESSTTFLEGLRQLALREFREREAAIRGELAAMGVEADD